MPYTPGSEKSYFRIIMLALTVLAAGIGWFIYSFFLTNPDDLDFVEVEYSNNGTPMVDPTGSFPSGPPSVPAPDSPPPAN